MPARYGDTRYWSCLLYTSCEDEGEAGSPEERVAMALRLREGLDCTALEAACPGYDAGAMLQRASRPELRELCTCLLYTSRG